jgi:hypothetical protein
VTVAEAKRLEFPRLVAVTVTVCCVVILFGAVYRPAALMVPSSDGLIVQIAAVLHVPATTNC